MFCGAEGAQRHGEVPCTFIFKMASTLTTTSGRQVILAGGANAANIYWQVGSSATFGTTSAFRGTVMADPSSVAPVLSEIAWV